MLVVFFGLFGLFNLNASLLQYGRGYSVLRTGLGIVPLSIPLLVASRRVPALVARVGDRAVLAAAFLVTGVGLAGLAACIDRPYAVYASWLVVTGVGITLALPSLTIAIAATLPGDQAGVAGGLQATTRELGSALGVAVIGTLLTSQFAHHLAGVSGGSSGRAYTVAEALRAVPARHDAVIAAYTSAAGTALKIAAAVVLVTGALVIGELTFSGRGPGRRTREPGPPTRVTRATPRIDAAAASRRVVGAVRRRSPRS